MPEQIVATAIADDANAHGLSVLSGPHMRLFDRSQLVEIQRLTRALETLRPSSRDSERRLRRGVPS